jgi:hypothetical protein
MAKGMVSVRLSPELRGALERHAKDRDVTVSDALRLAVLHLLEHSGSPGVARARRAERPANPALRRPMRTGRTLGRTLYIQASGSDRNADRCIGLVDTRQIAEAIVRSVNQANGFGD